ncbi:MAG: tyrosine-type recombinase/integrase [Actinomycetota bacterium]
MGHVQRRGKSWRARYIGPDGKERSRSFPRKVDAQRFLSTAETDKARGEWIDPRLGRRTFAEWCQEFEGSRVHLEETTKAQHGALIRTHVMPAFGDRPLASITEMQVQSFVSDLLAKGLAPSTVSKVLGILSQILKAATRNQLIARNPCEGVVGPGEKPQEERIFLTPEQLGALADEIGAQFRPMVLVAGYRGLRFGELAGLRPRRLNLLLGKLEVAEALKESRGRLYFGLPKHDRVRTVSLPPFLVDILRDHIEAFPPQGDLVFTSQDGAFLRRSNFERRIWAPAVLRAGIDERLTFHGLRHTAVSILIAEGASIVELAAVMGWAPSTAVAMAMRYGHLFAARDEHLTQALERVYRSAGRPNDGQSAIPMKKRSTESGA